MAHESMQHPTDSRRELSVRCDVTGLVSDADAVALRLLGLSEGMSIERLCVDGSQEKLRLFLARAAREPVDDWEITLAAHGQATTFSCAGRPAEGGGVHLTACAYPNGYLETLRQLAEHMDDVVRLNRDISKQRKHIEAQHAELTRTHRELDESNRGVVSLHAELAERGDTLFRAGDVNKRIFTNVSHEFRTPLNSILGLSRLLLDDADGPLSDEQRKQVTFIRSCADELSQLVNDMLDLSQAESGRAIVRPQKFSATDFMAALRGTLRPLATNPEVALILDEPEGLPTLETDQGKLAQILRNLVSNALKFTERGQIHLSVTCDERSVTFKVRDTGIGIAPRDFERIFEDFGQVENTLQRKVKGTGLGLPLSRRLAELLGGSIDVESRLGEGSLFTLTIPREHPETETYNTIANQPLDSGRAPVLVVEDDRKTIFIYEKFLSMAGYQVIPARDTATARQVLKELKPAAIVLDVMLEGESTWELLGELKNSPETADVPVLVVTVTNKEQKARALGADEFWLKPVDQGRLLRKLRSLAQRRAHPDGAKHRVLVIDDDAHARYLIRKYLVDSGYEFLEAENGTQGVEIARTQRPDIILLDFLLRGHTAFDVIDALKSDPHTRAIPVVVVTSHVLPQEERARLAQHTETILSKETLSRELAINRIRDVLDKAGIGVTKRAE